MTEKITHRPLAQSYDREQLEEHSSYPWEAEQQDKIVARPLGRGRGRLLNENLRRLPSEYVADDPDDPNRVHEIDPAHVRETIAIDRYDAETEDEAKGPDKIYVPVPLKQEYVDLLILKVRAALLGTIERQHKQTGQALVHVRHLWFPANDLWERELRDGNPPADSERPEWMRGLDVAVDPMRLQPRIERMITDDPETHQRYVRELLDHLDGPAEEMARQWATAELASGLGHLQ